MTVDLATGCAFAARLKRDAGFSRIRRSLAVQRPGQLDGVRLKLLDIASDEQVRVPKSSVGQAAAEQLGRMILVDRRGVGHVAVIRFALGQGDSGIRTPNVRLAKRVSCVGCFRLAFCPGMNRIEERFQRLKQDGQKGFVVYIGAGDPDLDATHDLALAFDEIGVDVLELGVPFSDPLADGLVNQLAAQRGLESGTTPGRVLETVAKIRETSQIPIVLYVYFNILHKHGLAEFVNAAAAAGVDGLLVLDLPPEESENYESLMADAGICPIYLVAPTTPPDRVALIVKRGRGFIYYVSREGVTGMQQTVSETIGEMTGIIRENTDIPIAVGFGISNPEQAAAVAKNAEAVVVGSAIVNQIADKGKSPNLVPHVKAFTANLITGIR